MGRWRKLQPNGLVQQRRCGGHSGGCRNQLRRYNFQPRPVPILLRWCALWRMAWCSQLLGSKDDLSTFRAITKSYEPLAAEQEFPLLIQRHSFRLGHCPGGSLLVLQEFRTRVDDYPMSFFHNE